VTCILSELPAQPFKVLPCHVATVRHTLSHLCCPSLPPLVIRPRSSDQYLEQQAQKPQPADGLGDGYGGGIQQLSSPFGAPGVSHQHQASASSFYGSPMSYGGANGGVSGGMAPHASSLGLEQYASAMSSQPSWASTSSNLWGIPGGGLPGGDGLGGGLGGRGGGSQQHLPESVPAAALLAAAAVASEAEGEAAGGGNMSLGDSELSALMATLMCR